MKKAMIMMVLALAAFVLPAEEKSLEVNGGFEKTVDFKGSQVPDMWLMAYTGGARIVQDAAEGKNALLWEFPKDRSNAYMMTKEQFKCKPGDSIYVTLRVKGKGKLRVCIFPKHGKYTARCCDNDLKIDSKDFKTYDIEMLVPDTVYKGSKIIAFMPGLQLFPGSKVTIDDIKVSFEKKEE